VKTVINDIYKIEERICLPVACYYIVNTLNLSIKNAIPMSNNTWNALSNVFMLIIASMLLYAIIPVLRRSLYQFIIVEAVFGILYCISYFQGTPIELLIEMSLWTFAVSIPLSIYVYSVRCHPVLYFTLLKWSVPIIIILFLTGFLFVSYDAEYNMAMSYAMLPFTLIQINEVYRTGHKLNWLLAGAGVLAILIFGARGPLIGIMTMLIYKTLDYKEQSKRNITTKVFILFVSIATVVYVFYKSNDITNILANHGIYSRTLNAIARGTILNASGRDQLVNYYWNLAMEKPFTGWGLLGGWTKIGSGPHNMLIELILAFGFIIGGTLSMIMIYLFIRPINLRKGVLKDLTIIYAATNINMLFVGGNILMKPNLFIFIALLFSINKDK